MKRTTTYLDSDLEARLRLESARRQQPQLDRDGDRRMLELNRRHRDLRLGFVDAAVMATAETLGIGRVATTDRLDFGAVALRLALQLLP